MGILNWGGGLDKELLKDIHKANYAIPYKQILTSTINVSMIVTPITQDIISLYQ